MVILGASQRRVIGPPRSAGAKKVQGQARAPGEWLALCGLLLLALALVEASLAFRVWVQLSGQTMDHGRGLLLYSISGWLVSPFARYETFNPHRTFAVLQFSVLVAAEAYLVLGLVVLGLTYLLRARLAPVWTFLRRLARLAWRPLGSVIDGVSFAIIWSVDVATLFALEASEVGKRQLQFAARHGLGLAGTSMTTARDNLYRGGRSLGLAGCRLLLSSAVFYVEIMQPEVRRRLTAMARYAIRRSAFLVHAGSSGGYAACRQVVTFSDREIIRLSAGVRRIVRQSATHHDRG